MASFVSSKELSAAREIKRQARQKVLDEEEKKFKSREKAIQKHKDSGNDRWMLPSIEKRIEIESLQSSRYDLEISKKNHKKSKKKKKKKKARSSSEESESEQWEEKPGVKETKVGGEREEWMNFDFLGSSSTYTSTSLKEKKDKDKKTDTIMEAGQHPKELNPFWKDNGVGLPAEAPEKMKKSKISKEWLLKSLKRMNEQAEERGESVQSIAAERYGSWEEFQRLLREASQSETKHRGSYSRQWDSEKLGKERKFARPRDDAQDFYSSNEYEKSDRTKSSDRSFHSEFRKPGDEDDIHKSRHSRRDRDAKVRRPAWKKRRETSPQKRNTDSATALINEPEYPSAKKKRESEKKREKQVDDISVTKQELERDSKPQSDRYETLLDETNSAQESESGVKNSVLHPQTTVESSATEVLTAKEKNQIAAKILKAELMGNKKLAESLKIKLEKAREAEPPATKTTQEKEGAARGNQEKLSESVTSDEETVVLTRSGKDGQVWPLQHSDMAYDSLPSKRRKKTKVPTHSKGDRERYFADDDRHSLQDLVMREKTQEAEDQDAMMSRLASKQFRGTDSEYFTLDDMYVSQAAKQSTRTEEEAKHKQRAIAEHRKLAQRLEKCHLCFGNPQLPKHLLIAIGKKSYLMLPDHKPITEGHCFIVPMHHCNTGTALDEDVWEEMCKSMQCLKHMFQERDMDCVFMQTCMAFKKSRHFFIDCIPLDRELGDLAPIYFKKAIQESETEWSNNKKLIDTRNKDFRKCIPKGLPYFSVDFGLDGGFAHVIEDEALFPVYFGREIVGGMLDVEPRLWRHPPKDHFTEQTKRSLQFSKWWKNYDWTADISSHS